MPSLENHNIHSQTQFLIKFCKELVKFLYNLILVLIGKEDAKKLLEPLQLLFQFIFQAKVTIYLIIVNILVYYIFLIFIMMGKINSDIIYNYIWYPSNILKLNFFPLLSSMFLHANAKHLFLNMFGIFIFGRIVEHKIGPFKTLFIYFFAGFVSTMFTSLIYLFFIPNDTGSLGASGALMGLVSAAIVLAPFYLTYNLIIPIPVMVMGWITLFSDLKGLLSPIQDNIGHLAHLFGFFSITICYYFLGEHQQHEIKIGYIVNMVSLLVFGAIAVYILL
ncbi:rhomboid family intramembrane serine protease [Candidatus Woesearchaeota archaeon]|nr:rhomboid family intramembrane serine protease [Candidatus Woesearchaeota archaeon]